MILRKIFKPEIFQGHLSRKNYFEGWYFKHSSANLDQVISVIPGIALNDTDSHAFIQVFNGVTGQTTYTAFPIDTFRWHPGKMEFWVGRSYFSNRFIDLDIDTEEIKLKGRLAYDSLVRFPKTLLAPGIMGWYSYVPFMECNHGIVSVNHRIAGVLHYNDQEVNFSGGKGYIEKDWGTSFPEAWIWVHCNNFTTDDASLFISVAKIPWLGKFFIGLIAFLYFKGRFYHFATYNNSTINSVSYDGINLDLTLNNNKYRLHTRVTQKNAYELRAPVTGNMSRHIKESMDSEVMISLYDRDGIMLFKEHGRRAGLEIIEKILEYL